MNVTIRTASIYDLTELVEIDSVADMEPARRLSISDWLRHDIVLAAEVEGRPVGYAVLNHQFFHQAQVEMLMVAAESRGRGIGEALMKEIEAVAHSPKLFVTTNESNHRMQRLLIRSGFRICGFINELDDGDPELVFFKKTQEPELYHGERGAKGLGPR